jgi:hypothetical protein
MFSICSRMPLPPLPIGTLHAGDFVALRQQRPLSELTADRLGYVRFSCSKCARTGKIRLEALQARFALDVGLVSILSAISPKDCLNAERSPSGLRQCGFHYRDL